MPILCLQDAPVFLTQVLIVLLSLSRYSSPEAYTCVQPCTGGLPTGRRQECHASCGQCVQKRETCDATMITVLNVRRALKTLNVTCVGILLLLMCCDLFSTKCHVDCRWLLISIVDHCLGHWCLIIECPSTIRNPLSVFEHWSLIISI